MKVLTYENVCQTFYICVILCVTCADEFAPEVMLYSVFDLQKLFKGDNEELSVVGRLAAGACAGMTSTLVSFAACEFETFPINCSSYILLAMLQSVFLVHCKHH